MSAVEARDLSKRWLVDKKAPWKSPETLWRGVCWFHQMWNGGFCRADWMLEKSITPEVCIACNTQAADTWFCNSPWHPPSFLLASSQRPDSHAGKRNKCFLPAFSALACIKGHLLLWNLEYTIIRSEKIYNWSEGQGGGVSLVVEVIGSRSLGLLRLRWARTQELNWLLRQRM